jgi:hypothetical protein
MRNRIHLAAGGTGLAAVVGLFILTGAGLAAERPAGSLFPTPFIVEHHVVQSEADGTTSATEPVTDYYGGSWLVSVRPNGSRLVVDFSRRELTEIRPEGSTYASLSFDRFAELRARLRATRAPGSASGDETAGGATGVSDAATTATAPIVVEDLARAAAAKLTVGAVSIVPTVELVRMRVSAGVGSPAIEVWCDRRVRLTEAARAALTELEEEVLGGGSAKGAGAMLAAARAHAGGAFPVRTLRRMAASESSATLEDVATRLDPLASFPDELRRVPDGYRRVSHPLEVMVAYEEQETALARGERPGR